MKDLIRKCYQEAGITDANAKRFENRVTTIQHILDNNDFFKKEDWALLTKWAIGAVSDDIVESQLIHLEEAFCEADDGYTNANIKELHILVELLLYQYCQKTENLLLTSIVVCCDGIGWKLKSKLLYGKFLAFANATRLALRQVDQHMLVGMIDTRLPFRTIKAQLEAIVDEEETTDETAEIEIEQLADDLEATKERFRDFARLNRILAFALSVQREESDILWWMLAEWSETCQKSYRDMSKEEAALFSAYELSNSISFSIGPYASKNILAKMISLGRTENQELSSAAALIDRLDGKIQPSFEECRVTEIQPILSALNAKRNAIQRGKDDKWRQYYEMNCEKDLDSLLLTPLDFGWQLYLEIELGRQLFAESDGV